MNAVGIDISKGKSMVAIARPFGEVISKPFVVHHTSAEISELISYLHTLNGDTRIVMEDITNLWLVVLQTLISSSAP